MAEYPVFIPGEQLKPGVQYRGYVNTPKGLLRKDKAEWTGSAAWGNARFKDNSQTYTGDWGLENNKKRTEQARVDSMAKRIHSMLQRGGWSQSLEDELKALSWKEGQPVTSEEVRALAAQYLGRAETDWNAQQDRRVTRLDPHTPSPGQQRAKSLSAGEE